MPTLSIFASPYDRFPNNSRDRFAYAPNVFVP